MVSPKRQVVKPVTEAKAERLNKKKYEIIRKSVRNATHLKTHSFRVKGIHQSRISQDKPQMTNLEVSNEFTFPMQQVDYWYRDMHPSTLSKSKII